MEPRLTTSGGMKVIGFEVRTSNSLEADRATAKIPGLWKRFFEERLEEKIPKRTTPGSHFGVYTNYEGDHTGMYSLIVSAEVSSLDRVPEGTMGLMIRAGKLSCVPSQRTNARRHHPGLAEGLELFSPVFGIPAGVHNRFRVISMESRHRTE